MKLRQKSNRPCKNDILLTAATFLNKENIRINKELKFLVDEYREARVDSLMTKLTLTLVNSIISQNRGVFILTRASLIEMVKSDSNWSEGLSFHSTNYSKFVKHISNNMELVKIEKFKRGGREVMICTVIDEDLLKKLKMDILKQKNEVVMFVTGEVEMEETITVNSEVEAKIYEIIKRYTDIRDTESPKKETNAFKIRNITGRYSKFK